MHRRGRAPRRRRGARVRGSTSATSPRQRRSQPGDDLISSLLEAEADGEQLTHTELVANCILLLQAGHETTQDLLGNAQVALFRHPEQLALLRDRPGADEERRRGVPPLRRFGADQPPRRARRDDRRRRRDRARTTWSTSSSGRSTATPTRFPDPDRLDITRDAHAPPGVLVRRVLLPRAALARTEICGRHAHAARPVPRPPARRLASSSGATPCSCAAPSASTSPGEAPVGHGLGRVSRAALCGRERHGPSRRRQRLRLKSLRARSPGRRDLGSP